MNDLDEEIQALNGAYDIAHSYGFSGVRNAIGDLPHFVTQMRDRRDAAKEEEEGDRGEDSPTV